MHLARPKSSKGRSRPAVDSLLHPGGSHIDPKPPNYQLRGKPDGTVRSLSEPELRQARRWNKEELRHLLPQEPDAVPRVSLNKYKVLPSIPTRKSEKRSQKNLDEMMVQLNLSGEVTKSRRLEQEGTNGHLSVEAWCEPSETAPTPNSGSLLLAVRAPCGRRFEQYFDPTDTLRAVKASAEARFAATYRTAFIETMDVPRRTFTDMDMTLERCGILNRSVLCISQNSDHFQHY
ncbi:PREDICTED: UBX domain-containing protein 10 [Poecilia mexicana]|uniref:UBX domain-containing protein 10-like n=1 Tax=Poecilia mexicana TaxID=48701 RepID=UPI00072E1CAC|nr:PREDICTED: UBX domain-containing protein 10-like [Poecilia mexicana]XP_014830134.1 PREDICTED: UBX domain-containing protein 10-like [Poecilia mexicana]XP_014830135.1 PREDICTED: UBX domain-containing protein 10-like [Poecilia mexicana]XP_014849209.1 PREDICTED: UBX domain-containing protein 10 [Poecilia mexicana]XP_014849210.1 PREDICTED: UBX domain-containing protein 10 [Poecilia mexicana]XP_014849211.1 PREDICTED: UBX domain-containing protein 10 [Poecilia mexicana]